MVTDLERGSYFRRRTAQIDTPRHGRTGRERFSIDSRRFGSTPAIAVAGGRVHIARAALENVNFVYHHAMRVASAPESGAVAWDHDSIEVVASASAPSITVDAAGALHVA